MNRRDILRRIPKVDEVLQEQLIFCYKEPLGDKFVADTARAVIDELRTQILALEEADCNAFDIKLLSSDSVAALIAERLASDDSRLIPAINATGTILHTNLGRSPLCKDALENVTAISRGYSNLEYNVKEGRRGSRHDIVSDVFAELSGAEDAMVVNNNASATMIVLSSMAAGREVIVSRGELVEIGGSFRIPEIMEQSGATLKEVGATNKTKISDYEKAINENTAALMKVHQSNFSIVGFTEEASLEELVELGKKYDLPVIFDMGNGLMLDMSEYGLTEPNVPASLATGIDVILFSGDKLLGGPQAGIIAGKAEYIKAMKKHPLARAMRVDKMTFAAMEATLKKYRDAGVALRDIPVLHMISMSAEELKAKANKLAELIRSACEGIGDKPEIIGESEAADKPELIGESESADKSEPVGKSEAACKLNAEVVEVLDQIGGGSAPMVRLPGYAVAITANEATTKSLERKLRKNSIPVIARIHEDQLLLCVRTIFDDELEEVAGAVTR